MTDFTYETLASPEARLSIARDVVSGLENDHYRLSLLQQPGAPARLAQLETDIARIQLEIADLEAEVNG